MNGQNDPSIDQTLVAAIVDDHRGREGPLLPVLHALQDEFGWIDEPTIRSIAAALNLSRAEVYGVASFYHDFRLTPATRPVLKLCRAEACQARGSESLASWLESQAEGRALIETVYCLGLCSVGPNAMINGVPHARLDKLSLSRLLEAMA
ncbi:formate dehydrogenase subunit gamma [Sphingomonas sp. DBB INV C78]|uniref:NAD(P)H-dependent oxidoreductase subunit E n=1 Tax=Sphingomonas sp. DBB INV C78 TaxID=3349434 RepID=UPI0036D2842B